MWVSFRKAEAASAKSLAFLSVNAVMIPHLMNTTVGSLAHLAVDCASDFFWKINKDEIDARGFVNYQQLKKRDSGLEYIDFVRNVYHAYNAGVPAKPVEV